MDIRRIPFFAEISKPSIEVIKVVYANDLAAIKAIDSQGNEIPFCQGSGFDNYSEINVSSAELLDIGNTPIEILSSPSASSYYEYKAYIEFTDGGTPYSVTGMAGIGLATESTYAGNFAGVNLIDSGQDAVYQTSSKTLTELNTGDGLVIGTPQPLNEKIVLVDFNDTNPTLGNGTIKVKIWWNEIQFG